jgi:hypothetical protein
MASSLITIACTDIKPENRVTEKPPHNKYGKVVKECLTIPEKLLIANISVLTLKSFR